MPISRPFEIVPAIPNQDVPMVMDGGQTHPDWRVFLENVQEQTTWQGEDVIFSYVSQTDTAIAAVEASVVTLTTATSANATLITATTARLDDFDGSGFTIESEVTRVETAASAAQATADGAVTTANANASSITNINSRLNDFGGSGSTVEAEVSRVETTATDAETAANGAVTTANAAASAVTTVTARLDNFDGSGNSVESSVSTVATAAASAVTTAEGVETAFEASYTLTVDAGGVVTGYTAQSDGTTSSFIIQADEFKLKGSTTDIVPFAVSGDDVTFTVDTFRITTSSGTVTPFLVSGSTVSMQNVEISGNLLLTGTVSGGALAADAVADSQVANRGNEGATGAPQVSFEGGYVEEFTTVGGRVAYLDIYIQYADTTNLKPYVAKVTDFASMEVNAFGRVMQPSSPTNPENPDVTIAAGVLGRAVVNEEFDSGGLETREFIRQARITTDTGTTRIYITPSTDNQNAWFYSITLTELNTAA